jgi:hypothetical protein
MKPKYITTISESESFTYKKISIYIWNKFSSITDKKIEVIDPIYNQKYLFNIWNFSIENESICFAIGEFSNGIYGVFVVES